ncbi:Dirigent protein 2 [Abeliophyllum distichum]|uniref:Dirigent protein n=1 Tax=Abeliophyllum distichum TaxID=126358 RepID=A0ABD1VYC8_9LAMI
MRKFGAIVLGFCLLAIFIPWVCSGLKEEEEEEIWSQSLCPGKEKVTKLHFYLQDVVGGPNRTAYDVAKSEITDSLPSKFGKVWLFDNLVTAGPEPESKKVGRVQGIVGLSDLHEMAFVMLVNLVFTEGKFNGSTLSILGRNPWNDKVREVPVVGGTGVFRMARGYVITTTYSVDDPYTHGVIEYTVFVSHFDKEAMNLPDACEEAMNLPDTCENKL